MGIHQALNPPAPNHPEPMNMGLSDNKGYLILGVLILRGLLCRVLYSRVPDFRNPPTCIQDRGPVKYQDGSSGFLIIIILRILRT